MTLAATIAIWVLGVGAVAVCGWLAWPRRQPQTGATITWSPAAEVETSIPAGELTPTELLPTEPAYYRLANGHLIDGHPLPAFDALEEDTHRALEPAWAAMMTGFQQTIDAHIETLTAPRDIRWQSGDTTQQWNTAELREAVNA